MNLADLQARPPTWCPGCGDYGIWAALKNALVNTGWKKDEFVIVYGIGCSGNMTDFIKCQGFHSLHGRAIPNAIGIKLANHRLRVICVVGDGDCYGEGGNHLLHAARGNHDIKVIVHDNRVYGLTTGQTAPTSEKGYKSKSTPAGVIEQPVNGLGLALMHGATFIARGYAGNVPSLTGIFGQMLSHKGFALADVLQPCVTFNKINTYQYYQQHVYQLPAEAGSQDMQSALSLLTGADSRIPTGIFYKKEMPAYHEEIPQLRSEVLVKQKLERPDFQQVLQNLM